MKRIKLPFVAMALLAIVASAFTPRTVDAYVKYLGAYVKLDPAKRGQSVPGGWDCLNPPSPVCTFTPKAGATAPYDDNEMEPLEVDKTFDWIIPPAPGL